MPNLERLRELRFLLGQIDPDYFHMGFWRYDIVGCALGWASEYPPFTEQGLHFDKEVGAPMFKNKSGSLAGAAFFEITLLQASHLFHPDCYPLKSWEITPQMVIERLDNLL